MATQIHPTAIVASSAELDEGVHIGPYVVIGENVRIGANTRVGPHALIDGPTTIGRDNRAERSIQDHLGIIGAIEQRDTERAERLSREHTLGLAAYVEQYGDKFFD